MRIPSPKRLGPRYAKSTNAMYGQKTPRKCCGGTSSLLLGGGLLGGVLSGRLGGRLGGLLGGLLAGLLGRLIGKRRGELLEVAVLDGLPDCENIGFHLLAALALFLGLAQGVQLAEQPHLLHRAGEGHDVFGGADLYVGIDQY